MSRRKPRSQGRQQGRQQTTQAEARPGADCPCGLPRSYDECCGRYHSGAAAAPTAEALMRSRYSAFVVHDEAYLLRTWDPRTRPERVAFAPGMRWTGLEILDTGEGSVFHSSGTVAFRARFTEGGRTGTQEERSRFARQGGSGGMGNADGGGAWLYVDGDVTEP